MPPWQYVVAIAAAILGAIVLIILAGRKVVPRLRLALLSDEQRRRLASYQRQAFLGQLAHNEARLRAAGEAKRGSAHATWTSKGSGNGATLAGMVLATHLHLTHSHSHACAHTTLGVITTSWDSWSVEERLGFIQDRQRETIAAAAKVLGGASNDTTSLADAWAKGCLSDLWSDLTTGSERHARSKGGLTDCLEACMQRSKILDQKRVGRSRLDAMVKKWVGEGGGPKVNADSRRRFLLELRAWMAAEFVYNALSIFCAEQ